MMMEWSSCPGGYTVVVLLCLWCTTFPVRGTTHAEDKSTSSTDSSRHVSSSGITSTDSSRHVSSSGITSTPDSTSSSTPCSPVKEVLNSTNGYIKWVEDNSTCAEPRTWILPVSPGHGTAVQVQKMYMRTGSYVVLATYKYGNSQSQDRFIYVWSDGDFSPRIKFVRAGIYVSVETRQKKSWPLSFFTIKYTVYPLTAFPEEIKIDLNTETEEVITGSSILMFNCSTSFPIPEAIACDGVKHCVDDEDEEKCEYRQKGCGDWVPYHDQCLKMEIVLQVGYMPGVPYVAEPLEAERQCHDKYGATLVAFSDEEGRDLVASMIHQSGARSIPLGLRKVEPTSKKHRHLYRFLWQWGTKGSVIAYEQTDIQTRGPMLDCAAMAIFPDIDIIPIRCFLPDDAPSGYVCMKPNPTMVKSGTKGTTSVHLAEASRRIHQFFTKQCADGSVVQMFHQCQWKGQVMSTHRPPNNFPLFQCQYGPPVHYTLVCDGLHDCADGSDETGCLFPQILSNKDIVFVCENRQVIPKKNRCDGVADCFDETDEENCASCQQSQCKGVGCVPAMYVHYFDSCTYIPLLQPVTPSTSGIPAVTLDGHGMSELKYIEDFKLEGYFNCSNGLLIPTFLLNNGELDCLHGEDEDIAHENFTCPGFYRCQYSGNCVHPDFVCDGVAHCPNKDDERYCSLSPPTNCTCEGYACSCQAVPSPPSEFWYLRYLDLSGVEKPAVSELFVMEFLQFLNVSHCQLANVTLTDMPQLKMLDLSYNMLSGLSSVMIKNLKGLTHVNVSGNPLVTKLDATFSSFLTAAGWSRLQHLVMHDMHITKIEDYALSTLPSLNSLDIRNNEIKNYNKNVFRGLDSLVLLQTDDSRLCCSYFHPQTVECHAPINELSSCNDLLRHDFFRVFCWGVSLLTTLGNSGVLAYHVITRKTSPLTSFRLLVSNLCFADLLMGVYMMIIGATDTYFRDNYVANERKWRLSSVCTIAGILAFLASEVSTFGISLITFDRMLMLCFPLKSHLHLSVKSCAVLCCGAWTLGFLLAAVPFIGQFEFYGESSICLPLPVTRRQFSGQTYAFLVFIVLNFLLFLFIGTGQLAIYWAVRRARAAVKSQHQEKQNSIAQRLFLVVFTDFCCWFPVGLMGILASGGVPIPGVVSVWAAVLVLPLNSVLNPFLYTLNSLKEKWNTRKMKERAKRMLGNLKGEIHKFDPSTVEELILIYLRSNRNVKLSKVFEALRCKQKNENDSVSGTQTPPHK